MTLTFTAYGRPVPQGSKRHVGRGIMIESSNVVPWRQTIEVAAMQSIRGVDWSRTSDPVRLDVTFYFDRPRTHFRAGKYFGLLRDNAPALPYGRGQGDLEKLVRAVGDACTSAGVWVDDSQVASLTAAKAWTDDEHDRPCAVVTVQSLATQVSEDNDAGGTA